MRILLCRITIRRAVITRFLTASVFEANLFLKRKQGQMELCWKSFYLPRCQTSNYEIILLSLLTFARDVLVSIELFSSQWRKRQAIVSAEKEMKRIKENLMRCKQSSSLSWRVNCKLQHGSEKKNNLQKQLKNC